LLPYHRDRSSIKRSSAGARSAVSVEHDRHLLVLIGVNRPEAKNLWNLEVIRGVSRA
jgi:predicted methyltransferase